MEEKTRQELYRFYGDPAEWSCWGCGGLQAQCTCVRLVNITTGDAPPSRFMAVPLCDRGDHAPDCECGTLPKPRKE